MIVASTARESERKVKSGTPAKFYHRRILITPQYISHADIYGPLLYKYGILFIKMHLFCGIRVNHENFNSTTIQSMKLIVSHGDPFERIALN